MAKSLGAKPPKPKNQGSAGSAHVQAPKKSGTPSKTQSAPTMNQDHRGKRVNPYPAKSGGGFNKVPR